MQTAEDRQKTLWIASQKYVKGEIPIDELEKVESIQAEKLKDAMILLSKRSVRQKIVNRLHKILTLRKVDTFILV